MYTMMKIHSTLTKYMLFTQKCYFTFVLLALSILISSYNNIKSDTLKGKWTLLKIEYKDSESGTWKVSEWMKNGTGTLIYKPNGFMSVEFLPEKFGIDSNVKKYSYTASYTFNKTNGIVNNTRLTHSDPKEIGKKVKRKLETRDDTLIMFADEFGLRLKWLAIK